MPQVRFASAKCAICTGVKIMEDQPHLVPWRRSGLLIDGPWDPEGTITEFAMTEALSVKPANTEKSKFYLVMFAIMALVIAAGFSQTVTGDFRAPGIPLLLHMHGAVLTLWTLLMVVQPALVARHTIAQHKLLGKLGAALALAVVIMGFAAIVLSIKADRLTPGFPPGIFLLSNGFAIVRFGGFVVAALILRNRSDWHKRLMYCAGTSVIGPGIGRLPFVVALGPARPLAISGLVDLFLLIAMAADLKQMRSIHPAYICGLAVTLGVQVATSLLGFKPATLALVHLIQAT